MVCWELLESLGVVRSRIQECLKPESRRSRSLEDIDSELTSVATNRFESGE